jgi:hypothetical protein
MRDQVQITRLKAEILAPPIGAGDRPARQCGDRRIEGLEYRKGRDVDASNRQPRGVTAEVVGERFDLG